MACSACSACWPARPARPAGLLACSACWPARPAGLLGLLGLLACSACRPAGLPACRPACPAGTHHAHARHTARVLGGLPACLLPACRWLVGLPACRPAGLPAGLPACVLVAQIEGGRKGLDLDVSVTAPSTNNFFIFWLIRPKALANQK